MPKLPQAVFFDLDGTLLDTARDFETAINQVLIAKNRPPLNNGQIRAYVTDGSNGIIRAAFSIEENDPDFPRLRESLLENYFNCLTEKTCVFPGLQSSLQFLKENHIPWGLVTNKPLRYAQPIVDALVPECAVLVCPDHVTQTKPDPEGLFLAAEAVSANPTKCLFAGDHARDIGAGNAAGMFTIVTEWGYIDTEKANPSDWGADLIIKNPNELLNVIKNAF